MKKNFIFDSTVPYFVKGWWQNFGDNTLIMPAVVIALINRLSEGKDFISDNARETSNFLDSLPEDKLIDGGAPIENFGLIRVVGNKQYNYKVKETYPEEDLVDNQVLNIVFDLTHNELKGQEVILVSMNVDLRLKAKFLKLKAENYKRDSVKNTKVFSQKTKRLNIDDNSMSALFSKNNPGARVPTENKIVENEGVIFCSREGEEVLARNKAGIFRVIDHKTIKAFGIKPKNYEQAILMDSLLDPQIQIIMAFGNAGTGKTLISLAVALQLLESKSIEKIRYTRKLIGLKGDNEIGFLPGGVDEKVFPFMMAMEDNLSVIARKNEKKLNFINSAKKEGTLGVETLTFIRGRSLPDTFLIVDEGQNLTMGEVRDISTRLGEGSKIVFLSDIRQIDNPLLCSHNNGPVVFDSKFIGQDFYTRCVLLDSSVRSPLVEKINSILKD
jgi:PhoH-like ATPase